MTKVYVCKIAWSSNRWKGLSGYKQEIYDNDIKSVGESGSSGYFSNTDEFVGFGMEYFNFADAEEFNENEDIDKERLFGFVQHPTRQPKPLKIESDSILVFISRNVSNNERKKRGMMLIGFYLDAKSEGQDKKPKKLDVKIPDNLKLKVYNRKKKELQPIIKKHQTSVEVNISGSRKDSFLLENPIEIDQNNWGFKLGQVNFTSNIDLDKLKSKLKDHVESLNINENDRINLNKVLKMIDGGSYTMNNNEIESLLKKYKQIILYGPPGTGKTWTAQEVSKKILNSNNIDSDPRFKLNVFHPSFEYEQFMRGLKPVTNGNNIEFKIVEGHFLQMCWQALYQSWQDLKNGDCKKHSSDNVDAKTILEHTECIVADNNSEKICVLVIDEINRGNVPALLGELVYAIEGDKRGKAVSLPYQMPEFEHFKEIFNAEEDNNIGEFYNRVKDWGSKIYIPHNLFIIGTMNTSDRSIGTIDAAIRRRFPLVYIGPNKEEVKIEELKEPFEKLNSLFKQGNDKEIRMGGIGHSYFMKETEIEHQIKYFVIPLIREYVELGIAGDKTEYLRKIVVHYNDNNNDNSEREKLIRAVNSLESKDEETAGSSE